MTAHPCSGKVLLLISREMKDLKLEYDEAFLIIEYIILKCHRGAMLWDIELLPALFLG